MDGHVFGVTDLAQPKIQELLLIFCQLRIAESVPEDQGNEVAEGSVLSGKPACSENLSDGFHFWFWFNYKKYNTPL